MAGFLVVSHNDRKTKLQYRGVKPADFAEVILHSIAQWSRGKQTDKGLAVELSRDGWKAEWVENAGTPEETRTPVPIPPPK